jgi:hypothetical protein
MLDEKAMLEILRDRETANGTEPLGYWVIDGETAALLSKLVICVENPG